MHKVNKHPQTTQLQGHLRSRRPSKWYPLILACLLTGCIHPFRADRFEPFQVPSAYAVLISEAEAQQIVAAKLERLGLRHPKINAPTFSPGWYWRVIVQDQEKNPTRRMTNDFPSKILSKHLAESAALHRFKVRFHQDGVTLQRTEYVEGYFWRFVIPGDAPGKEIFWSISAKDGTQLWD